MTKTGLAAILAAAMLAGCAAGTGAGPSAVNEAALTDEMLSPNPMLSPGEIDDATGTEIP